MCAPGSALCMPLDAFSCSPQDRGPLLLAPASVTSLTCTTSPPHPVAGPGAVPSCTEAPPTHLPTHSQHLHTFCPQILVKGSLFIACIDHRVFVKGLLCIASDSWGHQKSCGGKERQEEGGNPDNAD